MKKIAPVFFSGLMAMALIITVLAETHSVGAKTLKSAVASTDPGEEEHLALALAYIQANRVTLGMRQAEVDGLRVQAQYFSRKSGVTHIYFIQTHEGIEVHNAILNISIAADGRVIHSGNRTIPHLTAVIQTSEPQLTAVDAVGQSAAHLGLTLAQTPVVLRRSGGTDQAAILSGSGISREPIPARLVYQPLADGAVRLAWELTIHELSGQNWWQIRVGAVNGRLLDKNNLFVTEEWENLSQGAEPHNHGEVQIEASTVPFGYLVYPMPVESPHFASPPPPADARTTAVAPWLDAPSASPLGWHATSTISWTNTQGNNVDVHKDTLRFDCGILLECNSPLDLTMEPTTPDNVNAALINLFYWTNIIHDVTYEYGFDEVAGNFQIDNFGLGGVGNDRLNANAQAPANCGASFAVPPDGNPPIMNITTCNLAIPSRDGALDNLVVVHEFGHGVSIRLTGGPLNSSCLNNAEQPGEGWSDWLGLMVTMEAGDTGTDNRTIGTWFFGQGPDGPGIRTYPYTTDFGVNPHTYNDIITAPGPHGIGEVWAAMLWDMTWALVDEHGFNPDFYDDWSSGGNNLALQLVLDGMKFQPCGPGFVDARDSILIADQVWTGGANECLIWEVFARRGLGFSADQGSPYSATDGTEAFDLPSWCEVTNTTGTLAGTITDDGTGLGINGASVTAVNGTSTQTTLTDGSGYYEIDLEPDFYTVTASAAGYISVTVSNVQIITSSVTTEDFSLIEAVGTLERDANLIEVTVEQGDSGTRTLTVSNSGTISFDFTAVPGAAWADVMPSGGTLAPGQSMLLSVIFDSSNTTGSGTYTTTLAFNGSFDNSPQPVDLVLTVLPPPEEPIWRLYLPLLQK